MILQQQVTLDDCIAEANLHLIGTVNEYYHCEFTFYIIGKDVEMGWGCQGMYVNLATGKHRLLYHYFADKIKELYNEDPLRTDKRVKLDISPETFHNIITKKPCPKCGQPFFKVGGFK